MAKATTIAKNAKSNGFATVEGYQVAQVDKMFITATKSIHDTKANINDRRIEQGRCYWYYITHRDQLPKGPNGRNIDPVTHMETMLNEAGLYRASAGENYYGQNVALGVFADLNPNILDVGEGVHKNFMPLLIIGENLRPKRDSKEAPKLPTFKHAEDAAIFKSLSVAQLRELADKRDKWNSTFHYQKDTARRGQTGKEKPVDAIGSEAAVRVAQGFVATGENKDSGPADRKAAFRSFCATLPADALKELIEIAKEVSKLPKDKRAELVPTPPKPVEVTEKKLAEATA